MSYPLTGATPSATVTVATSVPHTVKIDPTRVWARPFATYSRNVKVRVWTPPLHHVVITAVHRQWGLSPTPFTVPTGLVLEGLALATRSTELVTVTEKLFTAATAVITTG